MASQYQMQAKSSANAQLYSWLASAPDWTAVGYVAADYPGTAQDITLTGGGLDTGSTVPAGAYVFDDGSFVVFDDGSFAVSVP